MGWGRSPPGWFRCQSGLAWDCFKTRSRNAVPEVSGPCTCYLPSVERPFKDVWSSVLKSTVLNPIQIPTSCKMRSQVGGGGKKPGRQNKSKGKKFHQSNGASDLITASFELEAFSVTTSSRVLWPEADTVNSWLQDPDWLTSAGSLYSCLWTAWHSGWTDLAPQETFRILYHKP